jgi:hypothetical protein
VVDQSAVILPKDLAIQNVGMPLADWEVDHFSDSPLEDLAVDHFADFPREDLAAVQVYFQRVDSQELVLCPGPMRLPASKTRRKTELPVTRSA